MSFEEGFEFIGAHALRANVGRCDLYILRHELGNHAHEIGRVCPGVTGYVAKNKSLTCRAHATWCHLSRGNLRRQNQRLRKRYRNLMGLPLATGLQVTSRTDYGTGPRAHA